MLKKHFLLIAIVFLGFLLRFYQLGSNPPSLNIDEVSIGYNAYSILKTGKDEFGQPFPVAFRSYDDYKPPLYIYLTVPSVALFGLSELAVRFPSALLGTLAILTTYFLVRELFPLQKKIAWLAAFFLAILPWHLQFTRTAFEVGAMAFFTTMGLWLFIRGYQKRSISFFVLSGVTFGLEGFLYQGARLFVPLLVLLIGTIYLLPLFWHLLKTRTLVTLSKQHAFVGFIAAFLIIFLPIVYLTLTPEGQTRFRGTSIFQGFEPHERGILLEQRDWLNRDRFAALAFHPEPLFYAREILIGYATHLRFDFLYVGLGGVKVNLIPGVGLEPLWTLPFLILGIYALVGQKNKRPALVVLGWIILSPIPAALTWDIPTSIRSAVMIPALEIVVAVGVYAFTRKLKQLPSWLSFCTYAALSMVAVYSVGYMLHMYFYHGPLYLDKQWYGSYKSVVTKTMSLADKYPHVIVSTDIDQPQGFFLYYSGYDPAKYQREGGTVSGSYSEEGNHLGKINFHRFDFNQTKAGTLLVGRPSNFPKEQPRLATFYYATGEEAIVIAEKP